MIDIRMLGPTALIVGGSVGIGAVIADELAGNGIDLILTGRSNQSLEVRKAELLKRYGVHVDTFSCDMTDPASSDKLISFVGRRELGLVAYIAGTVRATGFFEQEISEAVATVQLNVLSPLRLFHHFGADMRRRNCGSMLLTSSLAGLAGTANMAVYSASKAFGQMLMESLWAEMRPYDVNVLSLIVHATHTPGAVAIGAKLADVKERRVMTSEEVAHIALNNLTNGPTCWAGEENFAKADQFCTKDRRRATELVSARLNQQWDQLPSG
jgi:short-subunit dehydrogenase